MIVLSVRNSLLYPESNSIRIQSMANLHQWLTQFLQANESLHLTVERDSLIFDNDIALKDKPDEQPLVGPLFRDGLQWIEFLEGVTQEELNVFIGLLCRFRTQKEEAEDDLVTCLWDANLPHIKHKTADDFWEIDPMMEINALAALIDNSSDPKAANICAHMQTGSKTVGMVLEALNKVENKPDEAFGGGGSTGTMPGRGGMPGQKINLEAGPSGGSGEGLESGPTGAAGSAGRPAAPYDGERHPFPTGSPAPAAEEIATEEEITSLFSDILADLEGSLAPKQKQTLSGALSNEEMARVRASGQQPVYVDLSDAALGNQLKKAAELLDVDDDDNVTPTDAAMAEALFKVSTYFDNQGESPFWRLTPQEINHLKKLVLTEEKRNVTNDCLAILRILLHAVSSQEERLEVVDFIAEEARHALGSGDVSFFRHFLEQLHREAAEIARKPDVPNNWLVEFLTELSRQLSSEETLSVLTEPVDGALLTEAYLNDLKNFLLLLPAGTIFVLVPVIQRVPEQRLEKTLLEVVAVESAYVQEDLSALITSLKPSLILEFINLIKKFNLPVSPSLLFGLTHHELPAIRMEAASLLLAQSPDNIKRLVHMVADPQMSINKMICAQMSLNRNFQAERILLDHLSEIGNQNFSCSKGHLLNCYRAFGMCASANTIGYLQDILMRKNWKSFLGLKVNWHEVGAAMALMLMPPEWGAGDILHEAAHSRFRNIKQAYEEALRELPLGWKTQDDD